VPQLANTVAKTAVTREYRSMITVRLLRAIPLLALMACAPEIGVRIPVPLLPDPQSQVDQAQVVNPVKVRVGTFVDSRPNPALVIVDGRKVMTDDNPGRAVEEGFSRYLRNAGARIAVLNAPSIEGDILDWTALVEPSFPTSNARATARIRVLMRDSKAHPIYKATFSGESTISHPMIDQTEIEKLLGQAMASAIETAVRDDEFVRQLSKGRID
jgi:hypothetical protein